MDKTTLAAILLFASGALVIGRTFLHKSTAPLTAEAPATCPTTNEIRLTDDVRLYIEHELDSVRPESNPADRELETQVAQLERQASLLSETYGKSKKFIEKIAEFQNLMEKQASTRQERLEKDRQLYVYAYVNEAVEECGVKLVPKNPPVNNAAPPSPSSPAAPPSTGSAPTESRPKIGP